jgi:hypothetical protein
VTLNPASSARLQGAQTAPAVAASTVAVSNPFPFACLVTVIAGTVTVIAVGGTTIGITDGMVLVPAGSTITLTYAVAPTWTWYGLA